jgi:ABC-type multidrug transport system fused ATPase/permease subunit
MTPIHHVEIEFKNVSFTYPSRPDAPVLSDVSFKIAAGSKAAFVGSSGSGKSTVVALLEQFYQPDSGQVSVPFAWKLFSMLCRS